MLQASASNTSDFEKKLCPGKDMQCYLYLGLAVFFLTTTILAVVYIVCGKRLKQWYSRKYEQLHEITPDVSQWSNSDRQTQERPPDSGETEAKKPMVEFINERGTFDESTTGVSSDNEHSGSQTTEKKHISLFNDSKYDAKVGDDDGLGQDQLREGLKTDEIDNKKVQELVNVSTADVAVAQPIVEKATIETITHECGENLTSNGKIKDFSENTSVELNNDVTVDDVTRTVETNNAGSDCLQRTDEISMKVETDEGVPNDHSMEDKTMEHNIGDTDCGSLDGNTEPVTPIPAANLILLVQVFDKKDSDITRNALEALQAKLKNDEDLPIHYQQLKDMKDANPDLPLLVLCMNSSRLGTDVSDAIKGVQSPEKVALLILHHQEKHALPSARSDQKLVDKEYKTLAGIFDFAFKKDTGLYPCDMNSNCIENLRGYLRQCWNTL